MVLTLFIFGTFGFLYSDGQVAGPSDDPGRVQKAISAKLNSVYQPYSFTSLKALA